MAPIRPRDLLTDGLLARLGGTSPYASALAGQVLADSAAAGSAPAPAAWPGTSSGEPSTARASSRVGGTKSIALSASASSQVMGQDGTSPVRPLS